MNECMNEYCDYAYYLHILQHLSFSLTNFSFGHVKENMACFSMHELFLMMVSHQGGPKPPHALIIRPQSDLNTITIVPDQRDHNEFKGTQA